MWYSLREKDYFITINNTLFRYIGHTDMTSVENFQHFRHFLSLFKKDNSYSLTGTICWHSCRHFRIEKGRHLNLYCFAALPDVNLALFQHVTGVDIRVAGRWHTLPAHTVGLIRGHVNKQILYIIADHVCKLLAILVRKLSKWFNLF